MMSMMMRTYLMKLMLQQSESRFFGFFILICFCGCFLLESVLLPLLLLLLLLLWLLAEPFLVDLFGAIALLVFVFTSRVFFRSTFSSLCLCRAFNSSCFFFCCTVSVRFTVAASHCGKTRMFFVVHCDSLSRPAIFTCKRIAFVCFSPTFAARNRIDCFSPLSTLNFNNCRFFYALDCLSLLPLQLRLMTRQQRKALKNLCANDSLPSLLCCNHTKSCFVLTFTSVTPNASQ